MNPSPSLVLAALGSLAALFWLAAALRAFPHRGRTLFLADLPGSPPPGGWPTLAVVLAARDEAEEVESAVRSLLGQDYPDLQVVAVDDRSADATGAILDRIAAEEPRLQVFHVVDLPRGWLGKTHALQQGAQGIAAEWVLFTDGDVRFSGDALHRAVRHVVEERVDHLAVIPDVPVEGFGERLFVSLFGLIFFLKAPLWRVESRRSRAHVGAGAFNLVRTAAFREVGGFRDIALSVDDDIRLGQLLKWTGHRAALRFGAGAVTVRWHVGLPNLVRGLEKNFFAGVDYRLSLALALVAGLLWLGAGPHLGLFVGPWWSRGLCGAGILAAGAFLHGYGPRRRVQGYYALALPLSAAILAFTLARSTVATLLRGGVRWRDTHYSVAQLRRHVRDRNRRMRRAWKRSRSIV